MDLFLSEYIVAAHSIIIAGYVEYNSAATVAKMSAALNVCRMSSGAFQSAPLIVNSQNLKDDLLPALARAYSWEKFAKNLSNLVRPGCGGPDFLGGPGEIGWIGRVRN